MHASPLIRINHSYPTAGRCWMCTELPHSAVFLQVERAATRLGGSGVDACISMPAADLPIVTALRLPDSHLITGRDFF